TLATELMQRKAAAESSAGEPRLFKPDEVLAIMRQIVRALCELHRHCGHADLKPANIMFGPDGKITILDLGVAMDLQDLTTRTSVAGTRGYVAPEIYLGDERVDPRRADFYALAVIAHELLVGTHPRINDEHKTLAVSGLAIPRSWRFFIHWCGKRHPAD